MPKTATEISKNHTVIFVEYSAISNMSKSTKGTLENKGKNVKVKIRLSCSILD